MTARVRFPTVQPLDSIRDLWQPMPPSARAASSNADGGECPKKSDVTRVTGVRFCVRAYSLRQLFANAAIAALHRNHSLLMATTPYH